MTLSLPPVSNFSFTISSSKTIQSVANSAKSSVWPEQAVAYAQKPGRFVRSAPPKPPFPSSPRKVVPCSAGLASSSDGPRCQLQEQPAPLPNQRNPQYLSRERKLTG